MAWVLESSMRPTEQPECEILDDELERWRRLRKSALDNARFKEPDNRYLTSQAAGIPLPALTQPIRITITRRYAPLLDLFGVRIAKAITGRIVNIIEKLEPGIHQYLPLELTMSDGSSVGEPRVLLNVCSRLDTIAIEHSDNLIETWLDLEKNSSLSFYRGQGNLGGSKKRFEGAAAHQSRIGNHALWYEYKLGVMMMSDALATALFEIGAIARHGDYQDYIHPVSEIVQPSMEDDR